VERSTTFAVAGQVPVAAPSRSKLLGTWKPEARAKPRRNRKGIAQVKRLLLAGTATLALLVATAGSALAAAPTASCSGLASSSRAGQPGAEAQVQFGIQAFAHDEGVPPGAIESEFSRDHLGSAEACLG
jgi:hypothetical protein